MKSQSLDSKTLLPRLRVKIDNTKSTPKTNLLATMRKRGEPDKVCTTLFVYLAFLIFVVSIVTDPSSPVSTH